MLEGLPSERRLGDYHQGSQPGGPSSKLKAPQGWTQELLACRKLLGSVSAFPNIISNRAIDPAVCTQALIHESLAHSTVRSSQVRRNKGASSGLLPMAAIGPACPCKREGAIKLEIPPDKEPWVIKLAELCPRETLMPLTALSCSLCPQSGSMGREYEVWRSTRCPKKEPLWVQLTQRHLRISYTLLEYLWHHQPHPHFWFL